MRRKRRTHSPGFKSKVALAVIQRDLTTAETVKKFDVHADQITEWKEQPLNGAADIFGKGRSARHKYPTYARPQDSVVSWEIE